MLPCSTPGSLYSVNIDTVNAGIPYADSFQIYMHYCIHKVSENQSSISVYGQIKYKKSVWGLVKGIFFFYFKERRINPSSCIVTLLFLCVCFFLGMIEKNCWQGLEEFFQALTRALCTEAEESAGPAIKRKSRRKRRQQSIARSGSNIEDIRPSIGRGKRNDNIFEALPLFNLFYFSCFRFRHNNKNEIAAVL